MATETDRAALHVMMDAVPDERLAEAKAVILSLVDPVLLALLTALPEDEELSPDELAQLEHAMAERAAGTPEVVFHEDLDQRAAL